MINMKSETIKIKGPWSASVKSEEFKDKNDLTYFAGKWNSGVDVHIENPYYYEW